MESMGFQVGENKSRDPEIQALKEEIKSKDKQIEQLSKRIENMEK